MPAIPVKGVDQFYLFFVHCGKTGVQVHDAPEHGDGHAGHDDRRRGGSKPYNEKRRQCGFGKAVQHDQIGLEYLGESPATPEQDGDQDTGKGYEQETHDCLIQCDADVQEDRAVQYHFPEAEGNP